MTDTNIYEHLQKLIVENARLTTENKRLKRLISQTTEKQRGPDYSYLPPSHHY